MGTLSHKRAASIRSILLLCTLALSLLALELAARIWREVASPAFTHESLRTNLDYGDTWRKGALGAGGYLLEDFDAFVIDGYGKAVHWRNNSYGFRNAYAINPQPDEGTVRILSLGDSFTAGYRLDQVETFSYLLEDYLNEVEPGKHHQVLISCIEDPVTGLLYLQNRGFEFHPQMLLLGITLGNDIAHSYASLGRGGTHRLDDATFRVEPADAVDKEALMRRFAGMLIPASHLRSEERRPFPKNRVQRMLQHSALYSSLFVPYQGESVVSGWPDGKKRPRLFSSTNSLGVYMRDAPVAVEQSFVQLFRVLMGYRQFAAERGIELVVLLFPQRFQVQPPDWWATVRDYRLDPSRYDVELPNQRILEFCSKQAFAAWIQQLLCGTYSCNTRETCTCRMAICTGILGAAARCLRPSGMICITR